MRSQSVRQQRKRAKALLIYNPLSNRGIFKVQEVLRFQASTVTTI